MWDQVLGPMAECRKETGMLKLFPVYLKGEDLFGLTVSAVTRIVESVSAHTHTHTQKQTRRGNKTLLDKQI